MVELDEGNEGQIIEADVGARNELVGVPSRPVESYNANLPRLEPSIERALDQLFGGG